MDSFCVAGVTKLEEGAVALGMVAKIDPQRGLLVQLPFGGMGAVAVTDLADAYRPNPLEGYRQNQIIRSVSQQSVITHLHHLSLAVIDENFTNLFSASGVSFSGITMASGSCPCVHQGLGWFHCMWLLASLNSNIHQTSLSGFDVALSG